MTKTSDRTTSIMKVTSKPLDKFDELLIEGFANDLVTQAPRLDDLAKQLITLQIAVLGLYAVILKLTDEVKSISDDRLCMGLALGAWILAQFLCFLSLWPKRRQVDMNDLVQIRQHFSSGTRRRLGLLGSASVFSLISIVLVMVSIFN